MLKGTGTRASKSRLATFDGAKRRLLFDLPNDERRTRRSLLLLSGKKSKERR
jgi:hypothetical protein